MGPPRGDRSKGEGSKTPCDLENETSPFFHVPWLVWIFWKEK